MKLKFPLVTEMLGTDITVGRLMGLLPLERGKRLGEGSLCGGNAGGANAQRALVTSQSVTYTHQQH